MNQRSKETIKSVTLFFYIIYLIAICAIVAVLWLNHTIKSYLQAARSTILKLWSHKAGTNKTTVTAAVNYHVTN